MTERAETRGVYAAVATPLTDSLEPDPKRFTDHCRWLLANGCDGLAPLGTTGEANSLSLAQRYELIDALAESDLPPERMIIGGGSCALADAVMMSARAAQMKAAGVLLLPPFYYKKPTEDGLFRFFSEVIERVGSTDLFVYLYHIPALTSVPIPFTLLERLARRYGRTIAGVKDSSGDFSYTQDLLQKFPGLAVFSGSEDLLLRNLRAGGPGCISATTNVTARRAHRVYAEWRNASAAGLQEELSRVRATIQKYPLQAAVKELLAERAGDPAWRNILPPNMPLSAHESGTLLESMKAQSA